MVPAHEEHSIGEHELDPDPHRQFARWFDEAVAAGEPMPAAMSLATVDASGLPRVRMMLLEQVDGRGFTFQTNLDSPKAADLTGRPHAALAFFWPTLMRQVRVTGDVMPLSREEVAAYFGNAPAGIQTMIRACHQSQVIADRAALEQAYADALAATPEAGGPPPHWGAFRVRVQTIEFWQARPNWLQDRLRYTRQAADDWRIERLVP